MLKSFGEYRHFSLSTFENYRAGPTERPICLSETLPQ